MSEPVTHDDDRRADMRHFTCYPFHIQRGEPGHSTQMEIALIQDLSSSGALLLTASPPDVGARVKLHLDVFDDPAAARLAVGHVVRVDARPADQREVWSHAVAVQFDAALEGMDAEIARLADEIAHAAQSRR